jgi:hypothetical protein
MEISKNGLKWLIRKFISNFLALPLRKNPDEIYGLCSFDHKTCVRSV